MGTKERRTSSSNTIPNRIRNTWAFQASKEMESRTIEGSTTKRRMETTIVRKEFTSAAGVQTTTQGRIVMGI